jgi:hypothetical protein
MPIGSVNVERAVCSDFGDRRIGIARAEKMIGPCDCEFGRLPKRASGTGTEGFTSCFGGRDGESIISGHTGSTAWKGFIYAGRGPGGISREVDEWLGHLSLD